MPLLKQQRRQYFTKWIAIYETATKKEPGSIKYLAKVDSLEIKDRKKIKTPWDSNRKEESFITYHLGVLVSHNPPILNLNENDKGQRLSTHRWTSKLGLDRAKVLTELFLETEPEWRLYENLQANGIKFDLIPGTARVIDPEDPRGRTKFDFKNASFVRYGGSAGFVFKSATGEEKTFSIVQDVINEVNKVMTV